MTTTPDPASSLQAKVGAFLETLEPAELELFARIVDRAIDASAEVEGFEMGTLKGLRPRPASTPPTGLLGGTVSTVISNFGSALSTVARAQ